MQFHNVREALEVRNRHSTDPTIRQEANHYLAELNESEKTQQLIDTLEYDNFPLRWDAAEMLSRMGYNTLPFLLKALIDPARVGDPRFREGIYHVLRTSNDPRMHEVSLRLMRALRSPASDISVMQEADRLLRQMTSEEEPAPSTIYRE